MAARGSKSKKSSKKGGKKSSKAASRGKRVSLVLDLDELEDLYRRQIGSDGDGDTKGLLRRITKDDADRMRTSKDGEGRMRMRGGDTKGDVSARRLSRTSGDTKGDVSARRLSRTSGDTKGDVSARRLSRTSGDTKGDVSQRRSRKR